MELQSLGLVDGEDAYAVHFSAGNGLVAKRLVPVPDETVEVGRVVSQVLCHRIEQREQIGVLLSDATHVEQREEFFQQVRTEASGAIRPYGRRTLREARSLHRRSALVPVGRRCTASFRFSLTGNSATVIRDYESSSFLLFPIGQ